jgi:hypothetical protein
MGLSKGQNSHGMEQEERYRADNPAVDNGGLWKKEKMADNNAKEARDQG